MSACRVCCRKEGHLISLNLDDESDEIANMLSSFIDPTIKRKSNRICSPCSSQLKLAYEFKKQYEKSTTETIQQSRKQQQAFDSTCNDDESKVDENDEEWKKKMYICQFCERIFKSAIGYKQHRQNHQTRKVQYPCLRCNLTFLMAGHLKEHTIEIHPRSLKN